MKFIHAADLHLDSPFQGLKSTNTPNPIWKLIYSSTFKSFENLVSNAIEEQVDFILLSGDLFDNNDRNVKAQHFLHQQFQKLNQSAIQVFLIFGNHDYRNDFSSIDYPDNVHIFNNQVSTKVITTKDNLKIAVTGFSYDRRWLTDRIIKDFPNKKANVDYQIGMLHGSEDSGESNYAPFNLNELKSKQYDYWALGHIHQRQKLSDSPLVYYSGDIQGLNPKEEGDKGYLLVNDYYNQLNPQFIDTSIINWQSLDIDGINESKPEDIINLILDVVSHLNYSKLHLLSIQLNINDEILNNLDSEILLTQIQNTLKEYYEEINVWVYTINLIPNYKNNFSLLDKKFWNKGADEVFNLNELKEIAPKLFDYDFVGSHLNDDSTIQQLKKDSENLLIYRNNKENFNHEN